MNNNEGYIDHLMILYLTGRADEDERREFESWLALSESNRLVYEHMRTIWTDDIDYPTEIAGIEETGNDIWKQAEEGGAVKKNHRNIVNWGVFSKVAASVSLFMLGWYLWDSHYISGRFEDTTAVSSVPWIEKVNKKGEKKYYQLPDGSSVWLNAESTLRFAASFAGPVRKVQLEGEAYFEVKKDVTKPFVVEVYGSTVEVLGTSFNVSSYQNDKEVKVALLEGKVKVANKEQTQMVLLNPGEELITSKDDDFLRKERFEYENTFGWKDGILSFDGADFTNFKSRLERWYDVSVEVKGKAPENWELRAKYKNEVLKNVLKDISFNKGFSYRIENEKIVITF